MATRVELQAFGKQLTVNFVVSTKDALGAGCTAVGAWQALLVLIGDSKADCSSGLESRVIGSRPGYCSTFFQDKLASKNVAADVRLATSFSLQQQTSIECIGSSEGCGKQKSVMG